MTSAVESLLATGDTVLAMRDDEDDPGIALAPFARAGRFFRGAIESGASTIAEIIAETAAAAASERQGRLIDKDQPASMEKKKREGYF